MNQDFDFERFFELLERKDYRALRLALAEENEIDIAEFLEQLEGDALVKVYHLLSKDVAADVFSNLPPENQQTIIETITDRELSAIIEDLYVDDAVDMLEELPANVVKRVLKAATPETRKLINQFLKYPENSVGSIMTAEFVDLRKNMTVEQAIAHIRKTGEDSEQIYTCYVTDERRVLEGVITVKDLLLARDDQTIGELMESDIISADTMEDQEEAVQRMMRYDFLVIPVVDAEKRLVGIVTVDDAMDVLEEEATEDIEKMAAITPSDKPYLKTGVFEIWKSRIPWLLLLMISATFTGMIITGFEHALASQIVLSAYIPMLMDTGGNCGSQASVTIIRGLSLNEIEFSDTLRVLWKEFRVSLMCGVTLSVCNFAKLMLFDRVALEVAAVICLTLVVTVFCAKLVGCLLPMLAKKVGFDPAVMASPFITTIVDAISLVVYFNIAKALLNL